ncbi:MOSC N-terminal beta barrel domain-containing protein [Streptomyces sp. GbtcB7]|uniref:MOSC domain-containing protein n=1 Tax=Streptomyces sp. GbtcB7 TaxID=2824752 RepID=UPI0027E47F9A|nr:MOSC N-terminal beta barrel domain-containing protein [Streptomyces sp. GbtcB7]
MTSEEAGRLGTVGRLIRYPVKSMLGEDLSTVDVTERGLAHDRRFALTDRDTGKVASAKHPRLWRRLLTLTARAEEGAVRITAAEGKVLWSTEPGVDEMLSEIVGRRVNLTDTPPYEATLDRADPEDVLRDASEPPVSAREGRLGGGSPEGTFFDYAPVHLLTTSTVARIAALAPTGTAEVERYRPNIVIRTSLAAGFAENDWTGHTLRIGTDLTLRVIARTPRCAVLTLAHGALPPDAAALRVLADHNRVIPLESMGPQPCAGVYAQVLRPGPIQLGDPVRWA